MQSFTCAAVAAPAWSATSARETTAVAGLRCPGGVKEGAKFGELKQRKAQFLQKRDRKGSFAFRAYRPAQASSVADLKTGILGNVGERDTINELLPALERMNPTSSPASSPLLSGTWNFAYTGDIAPGLVPSPTRELALLMYAGGRTPALTGLNIAAALPESLVQVTDKKLVIGEGGMTIATCKVSIFGGRSTEVKLRTKLSPESDVRMRETYEDIDLGTGRMVEIPPQMRFERSLVVTYLDDNLLVVRDRNGTPDILQKVSPLLDLVTPAVAEEVEVETLEPLNASEVTDPPSDSM